ncbi:hypothetical protein FQN55_001295 [Onygenales sp. PD_40]|nr:hypothetical protein FQN55_001295 [Onygenales sp. PD_40]KAK2801903.1 hypothetical protein FQN51_005052 [Onygenales sp. PD_10]
MSSSAAFFQFWWTDLTRDAFLESLPKEDLLSMRLVCHDFAYRTAPVLFKELDIEFRNGTFTRPARMAALERIGCHIKTLNFNTPHSSETFLPPLLDPATGEEQTFVYTPQVYASHPAASRLSLPRYGTWEMTELLTKQYPPLFHAATNVPSFIRAFNTMTSLRHLKVACDGQNPAHRYRRSVVDYVLISLRIAIEQAPLKALNTLSLLPIHPGAILYLRPNMGFGASPSSRKRWAQIRKLSIEMDSFPYSDGRPNDHLRLLHSYLQSFPNLTRFAFRWRGEKGPCPLSLATEPCLLPSTTSTEPASTLCPNRSSAPMQSLTFRKLQYTSVENATLDAAQISYFITEHRHTVLEFSFDQTSLRTGTWDEALAPLTRISGSERWKRQNKRGRDKKAAAKQEATTTAVGVEEMDVPIMLSPVGMERRHIQKVLWEEERRKDKLKNFRAYGQHLSRAGLSRTRELFWCSPEHMRKILRGPMFSWR